MNKLANEIMQMVNDQPFASDKMLLDQIISLCLLVINVNDEY